MTVAIAERCCPNEFCPGHLRINPNYIDDYGNGEPHCDICGKTAAQAKARCQEIKQKLEEQKLNAERERIMSEVKFNPNNIKSAPDPITKPKHSKERSKYLRAHIDEIRDDLGKLGFKGLREKWGVSSSTIFKFRHAGLLPMSDRKIKTAQVPPLPKVGKLPAAEPLVAKSDHGALKSPLPPYPAFSDSWAKETQIKWLEVFRELKRS